MFEADKTLVKGDPGVKGVYGVEMRISGKYRVRCQVMKSLDLIPCPVGIFEAALRRGKWEVCILESFLRQPCGEWAE